MCGVVIGGTGGSDTAGMGGRGGAYRLDKGHKVHQVSDEDKQISAEARARAAQMGKVYHNLLNL
jgi:von Willebrand factor A domain-containing protein 8